MRIIGIDPGLAIVGFGILDSERRQPRHVRHGVIRTPPEDSLERRLLTIHEDLNQLLDTFKPDSAAIEKLYFNKNVTTGIPVAHARGVILLTLTMRGIPISEYSPQHVKMAVTGYGNAEKQQVMELCRQLLKLEAIPRPDDAADALAIGVCHVFSVRGNERIGRA